MKELLKLFRESVVVQGFITACFVGTTCYLWAMGQVVPDRLWTANTIVLVFFFGSKMQQSIDTFKK